MGLSCRRQVDGVERRVDDAHGAAPRLDLQQVAARPRHAEHVAERAEGDIGLRGNGVGPVDHLQGRDAHRTTGAVDEFHLRRQHPVEAVLDDGVRLPAADFHQGPRSPHGAGDGCG